MKQQIPAAALVHPVIQWHLSAGRLIVKHSHILQDVRWLGWHFRGHKLTCFEWFQNMDIHERS